MQKCKIPMIQDNDLFDMLQAVLTEESEELTKLRKIFANMCDLNHTWCVRTKDGVVSKYATLFEALHNIGPDDEYYHEGSPTFVGKFVQPTQLVALPNLDTVG